MSVSDDKTMEIDAAEEEALLNLVVCKKKSAAPAQTSKKRPRDTDLKEESEKQTEKKSNSTGKSKQKAPVVAALVKTKPGLTYTIIADRYGYMGCLIADALVLFSYDLIDIIAAYAAFPRIVLQIPGSNGYYVGHGCGYLDSFGSVIHTMVLERCNGDSWNVGRFANVSNLEMRVVEPDHHMIHNQRFDSISFAELQFRLFLGDSMRDPHLGQLSILDDRGKEMDKDSAF